MKWPCLVESFHAVSSVTLRLFASQVRERRTKGILFIYLFIRSSQRSPLIHTSWQIVGNHFLRRAVNCPSLSLSDSPLPPSIMHLHMHIHTCAHARAYLSTTIVLTVRRQVSSVMQTFIPPSDEGCPHYMHAAVCNQFISCSNLFTAVSHRDLTRTPVHHGIMFLLFNHLGVSLY